MTRGRDDLGVESGAAERVRHEVGAMGGVGVVLRLGGDAGDGEQIFELLQVLGAAAVKERGERVGHVETYLVEAQSVVAA